jgi:hypothetical protein
LNLRRRWEREVSLDYLMNEKFVQLAEPEQLEEYLFTACGQTAVLYHAELAAAEIDNHKATLEGRRLMAVLFNRALRQEVLGF